MQTDKTAEANGNVAGAQGVRFLSVTFRRIHLVVFLIFVFAVVQMFTLWQVCKTGMQTASSLAYQGLPSLKEMAALQENLALYRLESYEYLFAQEAQKAGEAKAADGIAVQMRAELKDIQTLFPEGEGRQLAFDLEKAVDDLDAQFLTVRKLVDSDFPAAMKSMDQDIPPRTERVEAAANALKEFGYQFSGAQAGATFASFGWIKSTAVMFGIANSFVVFCAFIFVLLAARRSRAQLAETLARLDERTQELAGSQALYQSLVDQMPAGVFRKDMEGRFVFVNSWYCKLKGVKPDRFLGKTPSEVAASEAAVPGANHPVQMSEAEIADQGVNDHVEILQTRRIIEREEQYSDPEGKVHYLRVIKSPVFGPDGKITGTQGMLFDITDRKQVEAELAYERDLLRTLLDNSPDPIYFKDAQSRFLKSSKVQAVSFGLKSADEMTGKTDFDFFTEEHARPAFEDEQEIIRTGRPLIGKVEKETLKSGRVSWVLTSKIPFRDKDGEIIGTFGVSKDITESKRLEAQMVQSQKLETVGKLAGGFAHEFNSILTAIIGQSELLRGDLSDGSPLAANATEITKAANRAAKLTRQLLAYGRKQFLQPEALNLNRVIGGMESMFQHLMGVDVNVQVVPAIDLQEVKADAGQIEQVIMNMVINARDAMPSGGKLTIETANVAFDADSVGRYPELKPGAYVMFAISDTGTGMSDEVKARVFEPFFSTKGVGQGTGLGLSTCYGIVKQSGGHISVYSEQGRGTTFKVYLPQAEAQAKIPAQRIDSPDLPRGTETILLVEDDPALREMAATLLRRLGYTVFAAGNGVEALSLKHEPGTGHVDLLFTDVVMPHMSGKELADRVRALYPRTKILFTSAYTENAIVHQGVLEKGVALLQKPFTPSALAHKLREVLDQKKPPEN